MKKIFTPTNLASMAALVGFLMVPGISQAACQVGAASALPYVVPATGMTGSVTLSAPAGCQWTFTARGSAFIRMLGATSGSGSAVIYYQILPNNTGRTRTSPFGPEGVAGVQVLGGRSSLATGSTGFTITVTQYAH